MTALERRYRRLLTLLPTGYRHAWEEDMVETYLSLAGDEKPRRRARIAEAWAVVSLAARLRLTGRPEGGVEWRQVTQYVALAILLFQLVEYVVEIGITALYLQGIQSAYAPQMLFAGSGVLLICAAVVAALWAKRSLALELAVLIAAREVGWQFVPQIASTLAPHGHRWPGDAAYLLMDAIVITAFLVLCRTETPATGRSGWLVAAPLTIAALWLFFNLPPNFVDLLPADSWAAGAAVMMVVTLLALFWRKTDGFLRWGSAVPLFAAVALVGEARAYVPLLAYSELVVGGLTRFAVLASVLIVLAVALWLRVRQIRRRTVAAS